MLSLDVKLSAACLADEYWNLRWHSPVAQKARLWTRFIVLASATLSSLPHPIPLFINIARLIAILLTSMWKYCNEFVHDQSWQLDLGEKPDDLAICSLRMRSEPNAGMHTEHLPSFYKRPLYDRKATCYWNRKSKICARRQGNSLSALNKLARGMTEDYTERRTQQDVQVTDTIN